MSLMEIQRRLKVPKNQFNEFGKYKYRSAEDILEVAKPIAYEYGYAIRTNARVEERGNKLFMVVTSWLLPDTEEALNSRNRSYEPAEGWAEIDEARKGMDASQRTGSAESYAKKYSLGHLFALDDTKDADAINKHDNGNGGEKVVPPAGPWHSVEELQSMMRIAQWSTKLKKPLEDFTKEERNKFYLKLKKMIEDREGDNDAINE